MEDQAFQLLREVASTPAGHLYHAIRPSDGRAILLLVVTAEPDQQSILEALKNELAIAGPLEGAGVLRPLEIERHEGRPALVFESFSGEPLASVLARGRLDLLSALRIALGAAAALAAIHREGIVHRNINPWNILVSPQNAVIKLSGFGMAVHVTRELQSAGPPRLFEASLPYVSPEQTGRMSRVIDRRADLYSLGMTLYQLFTGSLAFDEARDPLEWVHCHLARAVVPPIQRAPELPPVLSDLVMKLAAKMPEDRYQSAKTVERDLARCLEALASTGKIALFPLAEGDVSDQLQLPRRLYGRERELETLLHAFRTVVEAGHTEVVLVSGYSGVGKSSLVQQVQRPILERRGLFLSGKFDQYKRNRPYSTIVEAFQSALVEIEGESSARRTALAARLQGALGLTAQLVVDVIPQLEQLIGPQPPVPSLPIEEAEKRFHAAFRRFVTAFSEPSHPLTMFLDDLQWADPASLSLIHHLATHPDTGRLLLVGAYRDNEVGPTHPLSASIQAFKAGGAVVSEISLLPLDRSAIAALIAETLGQPLEAISPLAQLVHQKTSGNPFFSIQFLSALEEDGLLRFDPVTRRWAFSLDAIRARGFTENVIDLLVTKVGKLPPPTRQALTFAAAIGSSFDLELLGAVLGETHDACLESLQPALSEGLISRQGSTGSFGHDRIQQAAYAQIPDDERPAVHHRIGRLMLTGLSETARGERAFEIVGQLNLGIRHVLQSGERETLARLNLTAGTRAKAAAAYRSAIEYLTAGMGLLSGSSWDDHYALTFGLHVERAQCEYLVGNFSIAEGLLAELSRRAKSPTDVSAVACTRIHLLTTKGDLAGAVETGIESLKGFGIELTAHPTALDVAPELDRVWGRLGKRSIEELIDLPTMSDPAMVAAMNVLSALQPPALFTDANLLSAVLCQIISLSLEHGNADSSGIGYMFFGMVLPAYGKYQEGYRFGKLGYGLVEKRGLAGYKAQVYLCFGQLINPWTRHVSTNEPILERAFQAAIESGDLTWACYSRNHLVTLLLAKGDPLAGVLAASAHGLEFARKARFTLVEHIIMSQRLLIASLRGDSASPDGRTEAELLAHLVENKATMAIALCWHHIRVAQARCFAGDYAGAVQAAEAARDLLWTSPSFMELPEYHYYSALAHAAHYDTLADPGEKERYRQVLIEHRDQFREWAGNCPANFQNRLALVLAELARIDGDTVEAERRYEESIRSARENGFVHHEGIAAERAAELYRQRGLTLVGEALLLRARSCFRAWGADAKVQQLDHRFPELRERGEGSSGRVPLSLDALSVVKASQTIASEIVPERLLTTLMHVVIETAGAERAALFVPAEGAGLSVGAAIDAKREVTVGEAASIDAWGGGPRALVEQTAQTLQTTVLTDPAADPRFSGDVEGGCVPRSAMCMPLLKHGKLSGVLYLENNLTSGVFTPSRVDLLGILGSQIVISLENAALYSSLERAMTERRTLEAQVLHLQKLEAIGRLAGGIAHDFNNILFVILGYAAILAQAVAPGTTQASAVAEIERAGQRAAELTRQLLAFSRQQALEPGSVRLNELVTAQGSWLERLLGEDVQLCLLLNADVGTVRGDRGQVEQVLMNLAVNARDAMPGGGKLTIRTSSVALDEAAARDRVGLKPGRYVALTVSDTGIGMDAKTRARIFEPFFTTKAIGKGTGLGLSLVYGIVKQCGGDITVRSAPQEGTTFEVLLPESEPQAPAEVLPPKAVQAEAGAETVLLVEDESQLRGLLSASLEAQGYFVLAARDGEEALTMSKAHPGPIHVLLTDVVMPKLSGPDLVRYLTPSRPETTAIFMSGYTDVGQATGPLLLKPFNMAELLDAIQQARAGQKGASA